MLSWLEGAILKASDPLLSGVISFGLAILVGVVVLIIAKILAGPLLNRVLVPLFVACDRFLVSKLAPIAGITLHKTWLRWGAFLALFVGLTLVAAFAPVFVALTAVIAGIVMVLAIYRAWERDEEVREEVESRGTKASDNNDLGNEILVGLAFLIVFFTLGFDRVAQQQQIYTGTPVYPVGTTALFVWGEVLKALPIVDASEVFGIRNVSGVEAVGSTGRAMTFVFRVFLDLLLIGALIRLVSLISRQASGADIRHLREKLRSSDEDTFNKAFNQISAFALQGKLNSRNLIERIALREYEVQSLKKPAVIIQAADVLYDVNKKFHTRRFYPTIIDAMNHLVELLPPGSKRLHEIQLRLGRAQYEYAKMGGGEQLYRDALNTYESALAQLAKTDVPQQWADLQRRIASILISLGHKESDHVLFRQGIKALEAYQSVYDLQSHSREWAVAQGEIGSAALSLTSHQNTTDEFEKIISNLNLLVDNLKRTSDRQLLPDLLVAKAVNLTQYAHFSRDEKLFDEAISCLSEAEAVALSIGDTDRANVAQGAMKSVRQMKSFTIK